MKIFKDKKTRNALEDALEDMLDESLCQAIVDLAYSEDNEFAHDVFTKADTFWDLHSTDDVKDLCIKFVKGYDMDTVRPKTPADPEKEYFRIDGFDNIESTNYPGDVYFSEILAEIIQYVIEHPTGRKYPEEVQEVIDKYTEI